MRISSLSFRKTLYSSSLYEIFLENIKFLKDSLSTIIPSIKNEARFLGIIFDKKINFINHSDYIAGKYNCYINKMKYLTSTSFERNLKSLKTIYNTIIR